MAAGAAITRFAAAAGRRAGLDLGAYGDLHAWSVRDLGAFWGSVADFFHLGLDAGEVLADARMPGASWFPGARVNYAAQALRPALDPDRAGAVAVTARLIQGHPLDAVASADAVDDFAALAQFTAYSGGRGR
jgi:acetoacetyl-CoA synthetase